MKADNTQSPPESGLSGGVVEVSMDALQGVASDLFDSQALLEGVLARIECLADSSALDDCIAGMLIRQVTVIGARIEASAVSIMDYRPGGAA